MARPIVNEFNVQTQELIVREMTDAEFAQYEIDKAESDAKFAARDVE